MANTPIFIGSSKESLPFASALAFRLEELHLAPRLWEDVFRPGRYTFDELRRAASECEFSVFVLGQDDVVKSRGARHYAPRDNVVLELGLFAARHGLSTAFVVTPRNQPVKLPSDLNGVTVLLFNAPDDRATGSLRAALRSTAESIAEAVATVAPTLTPSSSRDSGEAAKLRRTLHLITTDRTANFTESVTSEWIVGFDRNDDRVIRRATLDVPAGETLRWRRLRLRNTADIAETAPIAVKAWPTRRGAVYIESVPVEINKGDQAWVSLFWPPLQGPFSLKWTFEYSWPGLWDDLRHGDMDSTALTAVQSDSLNASYVFEGWKDRPDFVPEEGRVTWSRRKGTHVAVWRVDAAERGKTYRATLKRKN